MENVSNEMTVPTTPKPPKEWVSGPFELSAVTQQGQQVDLAISSYVQSRDHILHVNNELNGIHYDIPTDGDFNLILHTNEGGILTPIASASIDLVEGVPTVTMIQRVTARVKSTDTPPPKPDDLIKIEAVYDRINHPKATLIQGENKLDWQKLLLKQCEKTVQTEGYDRLRIISGFASKYLEVGHNLPMAVQQYDYLLSNMADWVPIGQMGEIIDAPESVQTLEKLIRKVRNKELRDINEVHAQYPNAQLPKYWQKVLQTVEPNLDKVVKKIAHQKDELPDLPEDNIRATHFTTQDNAEQILESGLDYEKYGMAMSTAQAFSKKEEVEFGTTDPRYNHPGLKVVVMDMTNEEWKLHNNVTRSPGCIPAERVVGIIDVESR